MEPLNYCRSFHKQQLLFNTVVAKKELTPAQRVEVEFAATLDDLINVGQKIMLPPGGSVMADDPLRALDETLPLRLPFPVTILEYQIIDKGSYERTAPGHVSKVIVIARERYFESTENSGIVLSVIAYYTNSELWLPLPEAAISSTKYLVRNAPEMGGRTMILLNLTDTDRTKPEDYTGEVSALLSTLNVLACTNARLERVAKKKTKWKKDVIPFDDYHILTVEQKAQKDSTGLTHIGRSPREHVRRGHIRVYSHGLKIWVNACVVAAGAVAKIHKDYAIKRPKELAYA